MSMLRTMSDELGIAVVKIIHNPGIDDETVIDAEAIVQAESGFFDVDTPIYEGDTVEIPDPRRGPQGTERRLAQRVNVNDYGPADMRHIRVTRGRAPAPRIAPVRRLSLENLHPDVQDAAAALFAGGHYASAVSEAFKSIEVRVRQITGVEKSGAKLMGDVFHIDDPKIDVAVEAGQSGRDEREGFLALFRGAMIGIRNPRAHELFQPDDPQRALEYLGFASLLHRRIDAATPTA